MGVKNSKRTFNIKDNAEVYLSWSRKGREGMETLKKDLCISQFGEDRTEKKLLWIDIDLAGNKIPIIIVPETQIRELETVVYPDAFGAFGTYNIAVKRTRLFKKYGSCPLRIRITQENLWEEADDEGFFFDKSDMAYLFKTTKYSV